jgi:alpha-N-arabinofuranosidase
VNRAATPQAVRLEINGVASIDPKGQLVTLSARDAADTNSITEPVKIVPATANVDGLSKDFTRTFPPYSVSVLVIQGK